MEYQHIVSELEKAAATLLAPPNLVTSEQRSSAEAVFLEFRKTKNPFTLCKVILEHCHVDYVLFEAAGLTKEGLIREWGRPGGQVSNANDVKELRAYLLSYVINRPSLSNYVRERIVQVMAIIIKRQSVEDYGEDRRLVLSEVQQLIAGANSNMQMQMVGCSILGAMLQEYATTVKSSDVGLPWEVHFKAKKQFELTDLKSIFEFCLQALRQLAPTLTTVPIPAEKHNLILRLTTLAEAVLSWTFINVNLPKKLISVFESDQNPSLRPGATWKETIFDPTIPQLFFDLHMRVRHDSELSHHTINCLVQLSSLNGTVMTKKENRLEYLTNYVNHYLAFIANLAKTGSILPMEALGCSNIFRKIMLFFPPSLQINLPAHVLEEYLKQITQLTCHFMKEASNSAQRRNALEDDSTTMFVEAFEHMLEAWVSVLHESNTFPAGFCQNGGVQVFNTYLQCNLAAPDGIRGGAHGQKSGDSGNESDEDDEIGETEDSDRIRYKETLATIGALGREAPIHSVPILSQLLESRISRIQGQIQRQIQQGNNILDRALSSLYDDLHWILLVVGNVLTLDTDGEAALIPSEIMRFSIDSTAQVNLEASLRVLASPGQSASEVPNHESTDPIIRLISAVFRLSEMEKRAADAGYVALLSPEVSSSVAWFLRRYALTYLSAQESYYSEMSPALLAAFGQNTEGSAWTVNFLLEKVVSNLNYMNAEADVAKDTVSLLLALVDGKEKARLVLKSEGLVKLISFDESTSACGHGHFNNTQAGNTAAPVVSLPSEVKRGLMRSLVLVGSSCEDQASKDQYYQKVLGPLNDRFLGIVNRPDLLKACQGEEGERIQDMLIRAIESFIGVIQGIHITTVQQLFTFLQPILSNLVQILGVFHNYPIVVELILELYCEAARKTLCYLGQADSRILYQRSIDTIQMYAHHNKGKRNVGKEAEEDQFRDLLLLMELLTNLLSKDFIDLAPAEDPSQAAGVDDGITAADVCLYGLNIIMPLMSVELLRFPSLCLQYFKTITLVCELYPDKICSLNQCLQKSLIASLEVGLTQSLGMSDTVYSLCCDFIQVLCRHLYVLCIVKRAQSASDCGPSSLSQESISMFESLRPFLKLMMDLILSQKINSDLLANASSTLYVLICCYPDTYKELVHYLIESQGNADNGENQRRLKEAFEELTKDLPLTSDRVNRIKFRDNFEKFAVNVRGFLLVK